MAQAATQLASKLATKIPQMAQASVAYARPQVQTFWRYARVELAPPSLSDMPQVSQSFNNLLKAARTQSWKKLTVKEAALNTLVGVEIACWFFIGECIGKGSIIGYQVPGAVDFELHI